MTAYPPSHPFTVACGGALLSGEEAGEGTPVVLLHGLTATRRYVLHGSRALSASGCRVVAYDARGHGESGPAPAPDDYIYPALVRDALCVLDDRGIDRAVLVGSSMGAATATGLAIDHPERVRALVLVTPAHLGHPSVGLERWDALSAGLRSGGPDGFLAAYGRPRVPERQVETITTVMRQRLARHAHPDAVADALSHVPRSHAFEGVEALERIAAPTLVIGSRDGLDPDHPLAVAQEYERRIPDVRLVVEDEGSPPIAWRGGTLSNLILDFLRSLPPADA